jgi:hypothetical protein
MAGLPITISQVLAEIAQARDQPFLLEFVKATGKEQGQIRRAMCYYGAPNPKDRQAPTSGQQGRLRKTHLDSGTIPLTEVDSRRLLTPLISHIIGFNGRKVYH